MVWSERGAQAPSSACDLVDPAASLTLAIEDRETPRELLGSARPAPNDPAQVKMICVIKRRPGMNRRDFIEYYETGHSRLACRHLPMIAGYRRNYPLEDAPHGIGVITEMWFRDQAAHDALSSAMADAALGKMFAEDEARLFDRSSIQMFLVRERSIA